MECPVHIVDSSHLHHFEHVGEYPDAVADEEDDDDVEGDSCQGDLPPPEAVRDSR